MKVQLVFAPPSVFFPNVLGEEMSPPMALLYIASYARSRIPDLEIRITDGCRIGYKDTVKEIASFRPDILGISFYTTVAQGAIKLSSEIKSILPGTTVVLGGPHATALPEETLRSSGADIVVVGEGEEAFYRIVKAKKDGAGRDGFINIPGAWVATEGKIYKNAPAQFITPLDAIPFPAWDLIDLPYYKGWYLSKQQPESIMLFSRGCPYDCTFCSNAVWKSSSPRVRLRSPGNIADEMELLRDKFGIREIFDVSDEFNNDLEHALKICREIKKRKMGITWKTQLRVSPFTEELAREMSESGCWSVSLGIESGNKETIKGIAKHIDLDAVAPMCALLKKYGIKVLALFMVFNAWEEDGTLRFEDGRLTDNTLAFMRGLVKRGLVDYTNWAVATPYPGSKLYEIALRHDLIDPSFMNNWDAWHRQGLFVMKLPGVDRRIRGNIKMKGDILRMMCMLKKMDFKLKDLPAMIRRVTHILRSSFK